MISKNRFIGSVTSFIYTLSNPAPAAPSKLCIHPELRKSSLAAVSHTASSSSLAAAGLPAAEEEGGRRGCDDEGVEVESGGELGEVGDRELEVAGGGDEGGEVVRRRLIIEVAGDEEVFDREESEEAGANKVTGVEAGREVGV